MNQLLLVGRLTRPVEDRQVGDHRVVNNCLAAAIATAMVSCRPTSFPLWPGTI